MKCPQCQFENPDDTFYCGQCATPLRNLDEHPPARTKTLQRSGRDLAAKALVAGKYQVLEKLGEGGMGVVYKAEDLKLKRPVALKFLSLELTRDAEARERFIHEAQAASALEHNNICAVHEINETEDGQIFIAMAYYEGETLKEKIKRGPLRLEEALDIASQMAQGLAKAQAKGIIHRDIKPGNVFLTPDGVVKILDFGLAKLVGTTRVTRNGSTMGTVAYMSPEQARGEPVDQRTDIWSFGATLYEMLTGRVPFKSEQEQGVIYSILNEQPLPLKHFISDVPPELEKLVMKCLHKDATGRFERADDVIKSLELLRKRMESWRQQRSEEALARRSKRRKIRSFISVLFIICLLALGFFLWRNSRAQKVENLAARLRIAAETKRFEEVYDIIRASGLRIQSLGDEKFVNQISGRVSIQSLPSKVPVVLSRVRGQPVLLADESTNVGTTPLQAYRMVAGEYLVTLAQGEFGPLTLIIQVRPGEDLKISRTLSRKEKGLGEMVEIEAGTAQDGTVIASFLMDKHEVSNKDYFDFVYAGGYSERKIWPEILTIDGLPVSWDKAIKKFVDRTGIPGPRFWSGGKCPEGKELHPVVGVSWYEANAYANWKGQGLPGWQQWWQAALGGKDLVFPWGNDIKTTSFRANFGFKGTQAVGSYPLGVSPYGCLDMAGNVREWLRESRSSPELRTIVGGSWRDPVYMFEPVHAESFKPDFAGDDIGFRCVKAVTSK